MMDKFKELIFGKDENVKINKISPDEALELLKDEDAVLIDVRNKDEYKAGHISGSLNVPLNDLGGILETVPSKSSKLIVYCLSGMRSKAATKKLQSIGYTNIYDLGGISSWPYEIVN